MNGNNGMKRFLLAVVLCFGMGVHVPVHGVGMKDACNKILQVGTFVKYFSNVVTIAVPGVVVAAFGMSIYNKWNARKAEEQKKIIATPIYAENDRIISEHQQREKNKKIMHKLDGIFFNVSGDGNTLSLKNIMFGEFYLINEDGNRVMISVFEFDFFKQYGITLRVDGKTYRFDFYYTSGSVRDIDIKIDIYRKMYRVFKLKYPGDEVIKKHIETCNELQEKALKFDNRYKAYLKSISWRWNERCLR